jgi:hypothetical protein
MSRSLGTSENVENALMAALVVSKVSTRKLSGIHKIPLEFLRMTLFIFGLNIVMCVRNLFLKSLRNARVIIAMKRELLWRNSLINKTVFHAFVV